jgi:hypothetical protein
MKKLIRLCSIFIIVMAFNITAKEIYKRFATIEIPINWIWTEKIHYEVKLNKETCQIIKKIDNKPLIKVKKSERLTESLSESKKYRTYFEPKPCEKKVVSPINEMGFKLEALSEILAHLKTDEVHVVANKIDGKCIVQASMTKINGKIIDFETVEIKIDGITGDDPVAQKVTLISKDEDETEFQIDTRVKNLKALTIKDKSARL